MLPFPHPSDVTHKIWSRLANWLHRYSSLKVWTTTTDDDGPYYKLTLWAFGSCELKSRFKLLQCRSTYYNTRKYTVGTKLSLFWFRLLLTILHIKGYFYLKKGFIVVTLTGIWKFLMPVLCEIFAGDKRWDICNTKKQQQKTKNKKTKQIKNKKKKKKKTTTKNKQIH